MNKEEIKDIQNKEREINNKETKKAKNWKAKNVGKDTIEVK
jgi:hypothetical protein